jgi:hypothetical protein
VAWGLWLNRCHWLAVYVLEVGLRLGTVPSVAQSLSHEALNSILGVAVVIHTILSALHATSLSISAVTMVTSTTAIWVATQAITSVILDNVNRSASPVLPER